MTVTRAIAPLTRRLRYVAPYDWPAMLAFFQARAIDGVEHVADGVYRRAVSFDGDCGSVEVRHEPERNSLAITAWYPRATVMPAVLARARRVFDSAADVASIGRHLSRDARLAPVLAARPGLRVPGGWGDFEIAVRAILGQQITVVAARRLAGRLVALCGDAVPREFRARSCLSHLFPSPRQVLDADLGAIGMPGSRRAALKAMAHAALTRDGLFDSSASLERTVAQLRSVRGIGEWTAQYIAMRACRQCDAFPATDVGLLRGAAAVLGAPATPADLLRRAEPWRPWRAYAAQHLWSVDAGNR